MNMKVFDFGIEIEIFYPGWVFNFNDCNFGFWDLAWDRNAAFHNGFEISEFTELSIAFAEVTLIKLFAL